jgi:hypothetical protein
VEQLNSQSEELRTVVNELLHLVQGSVPGEPTAKASSAHELAVKPVATVAAPPAHQRPTQDDDFSDFNMKAA